MGADRVKQSGSICLSALECCLEITPFLTPLAPPMVSFLSITSLMFLDSLVGTLHRSRQGGRLVKGLVLFFGLLLLFRWDTASIPCAIYSLLPSVAPPASPPTSDSPRLGDSLA